MIIKNPKYKLINNPPPQKKQELQINNPIRAIKSFRSNMSSILNKKSSTIPSTQSTNNRSTSNIKMNPFSTFFNETFQECSSL
jgi:hypothetical protein